MQQNTQSKCHLRDLTPEESAELTRRSLKSQYVRLIKEFLKSDKQIAKVETGNTPATTVYYGLRRTIEHLNVDVEARGLNRGVVLVRKGTLEKQG